MNSRPSMRVLLAIAAVALAVRGAAVAARFESLKNDPDGYRAIAANLVEYGVYARNPPPGEMELQPTAFRPPLYVLLLAAVSPAGPATALVVGLLQCALGAISAVLLFLLARDWGLGGASYLAAGLFIFDPLLIAATTEVMTETLATLLAVATLFLAGKSLKNPAWRTSLAAGALFGLAALCRPTFWPFVILAMAWRIFSIEAPSKRLDRRVACMLCAFLAIVVPWVVRNQLSLGKGILTTSHGGYTKWLGNSDEFYDHLHATGGSPVYDAESVNAQWKSSGDELADDAHFNGLANEAIGKRPRTFLWASGLRVAWLWNPLPHKLREQETRATSLSRYAVGAWYLAVYSLAVIGLWRLGRQLVRAPWVFSLLLCLTVTAVHTVYWSNMRMRAPLVPAISLFAAAAFVRFPAKGKDVDE